LAYNVLEILKIEEYGKVGSFQNSSLERGHMKFKVEYGCDRTQNLKYFDLSLSFSSSKL